MYDDTAAVDNSRLASIAGHLMAAKMLSLASFVMFIYDIVLTMEDEIERIWSRKFSILTGLYAINRYVTLLGYIVIIVSFHDPWSKSVCNRYVLFPEILKLFTAFAVGAVFILRLYAIYSKKLVVAILGGLCLAVELAVKVWSFIDGTSLTLPDGLVGCILIGRTSIRMASTWIAELIFNSIVFIATLYRMLHPTHRQHGIGGQRGRVFVDGVIFFGVIFVVNVVTVLIYMTVDPDIKTINATFNTLITSLMVSRLVLNLRQSYDDLKVPQLGGMTSSKEWIPMSRSH